MQMTFDADRLRWDLRWRELLLRLHLQEGVLLCEHFGPVHNLAPLSSWPPPDPILVTRSEARVGLAPSERSALWKLAGWQQPSTHELVVLLQGCGVPLHAEVCLRVDAGSGALLRSTVLRHDGDGEPVELSSAQSFSVLLPPGFETLVHLAGQLVAETQVQRLPLSQTPVLLESRAGKTGYRFAPYVALLAPGHTFVGELFWSGNWQMHVERLPSGHVHVSGGLNPWGFRHRLDPGDSLALPEAAIICVEGDLNAATHRLHDLLRRRRPDPERRVPVHFNTWYPATEKIPIERAKQYAARAAALGCEVFVLDAGWYRAEVEREGDGWWSKTGDWIVDERLYPNGLEELAAYCRALGLGFGLWFEPEAIGTGTRIRRDHPEWLHAIGGRAPGDNERGVLHLGIPQAREAMRDQVLDVLRRTGAIWMKWDFNTDLHQGGWSPNIPDILTRQDPLIAHYLGLYTLQDDLRAALPHLVLEMCAGGGSRFDGAIMAHAHTCWMSDQTQALKNLTIHFGSQLAHLPVECNDWLVEWPPHDALHGRQGTDPRGDLPFRTRVAMLGTFGISAPLDQWSDQEMVTVREHISWYKRVVQPLAQFGDQYFLTDPPPLDGNGDWAAVWYAAKGGERGALLAFRLAGQTRQREFPLPGLDPDARFRVASMGGDVIEYTGKELAAGCSVCCSEPFRSVLVSVAPED